MEHYITSKDLEDNIYQICENAIKKDDIFHVSYSKGNVVLISEKRYQDLLETIYLSNPAIKKSLVEGKNAKQEELVDEENVRW